MFVGGTGADKQFQYNLYTSILYKRVHIQIGEKAIIWFTTTFDTLIDSEKAESKTS